MPRLLRLLALRASRGALCVVMSVAGTAGSALALGLGAAPGSVPLGQALDFNVPVRLDGDETLVQDCVQAEVLVGERSVPANVRLRSTSANSALLRITTTVSMDEPVLTINVTAGCGARVNRRYVVLADPGQALAPVAVGTPALATTPAAGLPAAEPVQAAVAAALGSGPAVGTANPTLRSARPSRAEQRAARRASAAAKGLLAKGGGSSAADQPKQPKLTGSNTARATARAENTRLAQAAKAAPAPETRPRLMLEAAEPMGAPGASAVIDEALAAVVQAASQARAAAAAASASAQRIAELERSVERARAETRAQQAEAERLRTQATQTQAVPWWSYALFALSLILGLTAAWLAWRMRGMQQAQEVAWARAAATVDAAPAAPGTRAFADSAPRGHGSTAPLPLVTSELTQPAAFGRSEPTQADMARAARAVLDGPKPARQAPASMAGVPPTQRMPARRAAEDPAATTTHIATTTAGASVGAVHAAPFARLSMDPTLGEEASYERTTVLPANLRMEEHSARDVSIEELIDVDQQAEFFIAIGQDHSAVDLLVAHLRNTGGGSPLTYLKLLDVYGRMGAQEEYERTRQRFNHRFNAYAPEWGADLQTGRALEDYIGVVPRLQAAWERPLDAMAELEALLFRKSRGELFDLPAYRDVLFLYALARDLLERDSGVAGGASSGVDLLLPLSHEPGGAPVTPRVGDSRATTDFPFDDQPTAPLDLDLTPVPPQSIFTEPMPTGAPARRKREPLS